jgi:hypothetical protein
MSILTFRRLADRSQGERVVRWDHETGEKVLVNPATGEPEPWPLAGVQIEGDVPTQTTLSTSIVDRGRGEGWISVEGERAVVRPAGPPGAPYLKKHTFVHADVVVLHLVAGDVRYRVTHQPDKYHEGPEGTDAVGDPNARVDHFYGLELEG